MFGRDEDPGDGGQNFVRRQARRDVDFNVIGNRPFFQAVDAEGRCGSAGAGLRVLANGRPLPPVLQPRGSPGSASPLHPR